MTAQRQASEQDNNGGSSSNGHVLSTPHRFHAFRGNGLAILRAHANTAEFSHLAFTFPLKLISPKTVSHDALARIRYIQEQQRQQHHGGQRGMDGESHSARHNNAKAVAAIYIVGYGGGLVSGDTVQLDMDVGQGCTMLVLTQGSTKVYKMREKTWTEAKQAADHSKVHSPSLTTSQTIRCIVRPSAVLVMLPDPVTCYARARYSQTQRFDLRCAKTSSLAVLDWFTPGRVHLTPKQQQQQPIVDDTASMEEPHSKDESQGGEYWLFDNYASRNEIRRAGRVIVRDVLLLDQPRTEADSGDRATASVRNDADRGLTIAQRCAPYSCYATLFLVGPDMEPLIGFLWDEFHAIQQRTKQQFGRGASLEPVLWSCSPIAPGDGTPDPQASSPTRLGLIVRIAGQSTEGVRCWLRAHLLHLQSIIGDDLYRQALG